MERLEFDEQDEQWSITEYYSDGSSRAGEPFPASGHERYSKLSQVMDRIAAKYPGYQVRRAPHNTVDKTHYSLEVAPQESA